MAFDWVYEDLRGERRPAIVGPGLAPVTPVQVLGRPGVTVTGSGNYKGQEGTITKPAVDGLGAFSTTFGNSRGGESLQDTEATVAFTGTIAGPVVGATSSTTQGTLVYLTSSKTLTLKDAEGLGQLLLGDARVERKTALKGGRFDETLSQG